MCDSHVNGNSEQLLIWGNLLYVWRVKTHTEKYLLLNKAEGHKLPGFDAALEELRTPGSEFSEYVSAVDMMLVNALIPNPAAYDAEEREYMKRTVRFRAKAGEVSGVAGSIEELKACLEGRHEDEEGEETSGQSVHAQDVTGTAEEAVRSSVETNGMNLERIQLTERERSIVKKEMERYFDKLSWDRDS